MTLSELVHEALSVHMAGPMHAVQSARVSLMLYLLAWTLVAAPGDTMLGVWLYTGLLFNGARFKV